ncbi:MAG: tetratricopeptide repeat protein [Pseudomonadota bacterium]
MKSMWWIAGSIVMMAAASAGAANSAQINYCGDLKNAYGPFDYRTRAEHVENFYLVEMAHFTPEVENGIKGSTGLIGGDLDYTLRAIPNHHRALAALARVAVRTKSLQVPGTKWPVECYFERAMRFQPDDGGAKAEYGNYLYALGKADKAFPLFREAAEMSPDNPTINYNLGLAYFQKKDYDNSLLYAKKAYALGFPLPGLKNKLAAAGKWNDK